MTCRLRVLTAAPAPTRMGIAIALGEDVEMCAQVGVAEQAIRAA